MHSKSIHPAMFLKVILSVVARALTNVESNIFIGQQ